MIVRFFVKNYRSFGEECEINFLSDNYIKTNKHHVSEKDTPVKLLRYSAIYGANGAGKSNLLRAVRCLQSILQGEVDAEFLDAERNVLRSSQEDQDQLLGIEIAPRGASFTYCYSIRTRDRVVQEESLTKQRFNKQGKPVGEEIVVLHRYREKEQEIFVVPFLSETEDGRLLVEKLLPNGLVKPNMSCMKVLCDVHGKSLSLDDLYTAYQWITTHIQVLYPNTYNMRWPLTLMQNKEFKALYERLIPLLDTGMEKIESVPIPLEIEDEQVLKALKNAKAQTIVLPKQDKEKIPNILKMNEKGEVERIGVFSTHKNNHGEEALLFFDKESDGTIRLMDIIAMIYDMIYSDRVFLVDEIERSLHPLMIKEVLEWLMKRTDVQGQLIFTTHNPILLDSEQMRRDEIWFVEKSCEDATVYSLNEYVKEHKSISISKGYMTGRYGAIPLLGQLKGVKW